ncbi:MAG: hypothetical protein M3Q85_05125, partial [Acidobacteriota bacterium]|nr:hypothetical protein [Acidobacteriota bacterium]
EMKNMLQALCMVTAFTVGTGLSAQSGGMDKSQMDKQGMMKDGQMMMSGCVAAGSSAGQYMLTNAMMMGGMMGKDKEMMGKDKMQPGMGGHMMSYELVGGGDMKAHMGHKVEVTGTMSKSDMEKMHKMGSMDSMDKGKMDKGTMSDKDMKPMKLNVKSVKMTSASCP